MGPFANGSVFYNDDQRGPDIGVRVQVKIQPFFKTFSLSSKKLSKVFYINTTPLSTNAKKSPPRKGSPLHPLPFAILPLNPPDHL
jgi:hypothetical protein